jgi:electron transfer flavoprotein beta subunit
MKIMVCVKQVPARDSVLRINGGALDQSDLTYEMNEPDAYALEEALQLKEKTGGGEVVVLSAGPERTQSTIREALAKGADRAVHVELSDADQLDAFTTAALLAGAAKQEQPDLILTGLQSDDMGYGQTGVIMAELLGFSHATIVMDVEPKAASIRIKRELEDGWFQNIALPLPSVLTIQSGIKKLRYATLMGIKKAKTKQVKTLRPADIGMQASRAIITESVYMPQRTKESTILSGDARQSAQKLLEKLRFEARVL